MAGRAKAVGRLTAARVAFRVALIAAAAGAALAPGSASTVERLYSTGLYRVLQPGLTTASNALPFALFDVLIAAVVIGWSALTIRDVVSRGSGGWLRIVARAVVRTATWTAALYLLFLVAWGLNYRRVRLSERLPFDAGAVTAGGALRLALEAAERLNALHAEAHATGWPRPDAIDPSLAAGFARANRELRHGVVVVGRPKPSVLDWYFRRASVDGMTDPYFLETLVARDLLPFERPFVVAHEWSHLAGLADEGEANFLGWLTCVHASAPGQYSGWLFLYGELVAAVPRDERAEVQSHLGAGPRADFKAIADRLARNASPRLSAAGWRVYDRYLKANRVDAGTRSYAEVVRLVLGVRFGPDWTPY